MAVSRRHVLLQGCVIGAGVIAAHVPGMVALAQAQPPLRRSLGSIPLNDPILDAWRDGVRQLKARPASDPISWASFAAIHGNASNFNLCPHGNWYFLPWHRAYLLMYERVVRQLTGHNDFALPYWDWTADRQLPPAFVQPTWNGQPNPLFEPSRAMSPTDTLPDEIVGPAVIEQIMRVTDFETFATSRPSGQNSLDQSWIVCEFCGVFSILEGTPHNNVHNLVGGIMASAQSALDPIFMMHHCNIDRLWAVWNTAGNANTTDPLWNDMPFQNNFFNPDGTRFSPKVSELLLPEPLGYTYDLGMPAPGYVATPVDDKLKTLYAMPSVAAAKAAGIATYVAQNTQQATPTKPLEVSVEVEPNLVSTVARYKRVAAGVALLDFAKARQQVAAGPHALAFIRDIAVAQQEDTLYRVFIDCDYLSPSTPPTDRHYVGTFGVFGSHGSHGGKDTKPSVAVDLTRAIQRVYGSVPTPSGRLRVQILPVPNKPKDGKAGTATPSRVEIAFITA
jgi:tyrosinase